MSELCGFVLAAGEGSRMRPATFLRPKALLPFCGVPLLTLALEELRALPQVTNLVVNAAYLGEQVGEACARYSQEHGVAVGCSREARRLNHGGGLRKGVKEWAPQADQILVRNVDVVHNFPLEKLLSFHREHQADVSALLVPPVHPGGVRISPSCQILDFHSTEGGYTFAGIYVMQREILDFLPREEEAPSILVAFQRAAAAGRRVLGCVAEPQVFWSDVGTPEEYLQAHGTVMDCAVPGNPALRQAIVEQSLRRALLEQSGVRCQGALGLGKNLHVPAGSHLHQVVLWDDTRLPVPALYSTGILWGTPAPPSPPASPSRLPDARVARTLHLRLPAPAEADSSSAAMLKQGSGRRYEPLVEEETGRESGALWSAYALERRENSAFVAVARFLQALEIPVPKILLHFPEAGEVVMEDVGRLDLMGVPRGERGQWLSRLMAQAARLHVQGVRHPLAPTLPLQPPFTQETYRWERDYFRRHLLQTVLESPELWSEEAAAEAARIQSLLLAEPPALIHRDFQGANVKVQRETGRCLWIDFQGMRRGAAAYDLASLLYDPYEEYSPAERQAAWREYADAVRREGGAPPREELFHLAAVQRLMQALGAYGKLWRQDGLAWYRRHIAPGLAHLQQAAHAAGLPGFTALAEAARRKWEARKRPGE
ncbi:MAG: sugar phosphate nucleotidyltransferase [Oligosphaeraceae bacterium]